LLRGHYRQTIFRVGWPMANPDSFEPAYSLSKALSYLNDEADPEEIMKKQDAADSAGQALA
ncbi:FMN-binding glutamate synthase family protein, partial [Alcaligenes faecalis]|nr:FMN-binding glutamate synthase family protein [Alcaligenes faecalis]